MRDEVLRSLAERLQGICLDRRLTVALAESCTGGLVAAAVTEIPGSSGYFLGGIVSYADAAKRELLGVPATALDQHGAVSAQVAIAMAHGARSRFGTDLAASVTGVAGPDGGTVAKPVGLTYAGVAGAAGDEVRRFLWAGDRESNRRDSALAVLELLIEHAAAARAGPGTAAPGASPSKGRP